MEKHIISAVSCVLIKSEEIYVRFKLDPFASITVALNLTKNKLSYRIPFVILLKQYI